MVLDEFYTLLDPALARLLLAVALGMFLGLEREWSKKPAGVRTFSLITLAGTIFALLDQELLLAIGGLLVVVQGLILGIEGLLYEEYGLSLTTAISMFVAYGVGILVAEGRLVEAVVVAVLSSTLLVLKRELHGFAEGLTRDEVRSAAELAILAFVIFPLLPDEALGPWNAINPRTVWLLVIAMSAIGFVNYVVIQQYGGWGVAVGGFFGALVNSNAVVGEMASRARTEGAFGDIAVGTILLADAATAFRNTIIIAVFLPALVPLVGAPLIAITVAGLGLSVLVGDWGAEFDADLESPFNLKYALEFGGLFLIVLLVSAGAQATFGASGFLVTSFFSGLVSSGSVTTTAVVLVGSGQLSEIAAVTGVVVGTAASILVKVSLAAAVDRALVRPVLLYSIALVAVGGGATGVVLAVA